MKKDFIISLLLCFAFSNLMAAETYQFDKPHSYVMWHANHFKFSHPSGKWMVEGTLVLDKAKPQNSKVNSIIHISELTTGVKELDEHLSGQLFFDAKKYPTATFVSDKVDVTSKTSAKVQGILTVHGVPKPVTLDVTLNNLGINPITNKQTVGFTAHTTLKRSDFGITTLLPGVGDDVAIDIEVEAQR
jgi:polyisoprenoid-binding protein YceI